MYSVVIQVTCTQSTSNQNLALSRAFDVYQNSKLGMSCTLSTLENAGRHIYTFLRRKTTTIRTGTAFLAPLLAFWWIYEYLGKPFNLDLLFCYRDCARPQVQRRLSCDSSSHLREWHSALWAQACLYFVISLWTQIPMNDLRQHPQPSFPIVKYTTPIERNQLIFLNRTTQRIQIVLERKLALRIRSEKRKLELQFHDPGLHSASILLFQYRRGLIFLLLFALASNDQNITTWAALRYRRLSSCYILKAS